MLRPLLYELFEAARRYDRDTGHQALGFDSYLTLMEALQKGIGFNSAEQLLQLCTLIWRKPHHDEEEFDDVLKKSMLAFRQNVALEVEQEQKKVKEKKTASEHKTTVENTPKANEEVTPDPKDKPQPTGQPEETVIISFEKARPDADEHSTRISERELNEVIHQRNFWLRGNYFEFSSRRLQQGLRALRSEVDSLTKKEIDLPRTIEATAKKGYFQELSWQKAKEWRSDLVVLIDNGPTMMAFQPMIDELIEVLRKDTDQRELNIFYFDRAPVNHVFKDQEHLKGIELAFFAKKHKSPILILSDGGAAKGGLDREQLQHVTQLLKVLKNHRVAWLNPMPRHRWKRTTADYISYYVNMFDANGMEFGNAVRVLKAKLLGKKLLT